jgi:hypothetical protein
MTNSVQFGEDLLLENLQLVSCLAIGGKTETSEFCLECKSICQRADNPCIVEIDFEVCGPGTFEFVPELTAFSVDTTDGINGSWYVLQAIETDPKHTGNEFEATTSRFIGKYVADMCDHVSGFFSAPRICFRLTVRKTSSSTSSIVPPTTGPYLNPGGSVIPGYRLPRN